MDNYVPIAMPSPETALLAYEGDWDYIREHLTWLDLRIALRLRLQESVMGTGSTGKRSASNEDEQTLQYHDRLNNLERHMESRLRVSQQEGVFLSLPYLAGVFGLSSIESKAIIVCLAVEIERKYETAYELLQHGAPGAKCPTPDLIATIVSRTSDERTEVLSALRNDGILREHFIRNDLPSKQGTLLGQPFLLDERIVRFVLDSGGLPKSMEDYARIVPPGRTLEPLLGSPDTQRKLTQWIANRMSQPRSSDSSLIISLWGKQGAGKKTQIEHVGHYFEEPLLFADMAKLVGADSNVQASLRKVFREATIQQAILVLEHFHVVAHKNESNDRATEILERLSEMSGIVFLLSEEPCQPLDRYRRIDLELEIAALQDEERAEAWRRLAKGYEMDSLLDWEAISARFLFNPGQMANSLSAAKVISEWNQEGGTALPIGWSDMIQASYKQLNHSLANKAKRLTPKSRWNDLILPAAQKEKLQHACNHIRYKHTVYGRWGFNKKLSYGTGISLLFSGPPGTGKTMASEVVAKELDMEIYKIDLSQIISKYIGETEKNLREIFDEAQASYAVLFFDEADALFGKRSEVKDSHDKNANTEVAFLLQKMEEYRGISILATNYLQNMDEAFLRRINYVIRFPFPDEKQRETIWKQVYPVQTPLDPDIDFPFLARKLQMAGGSIKNIAMTSAFLASGQEERVGMKHIFKAYQYELDKTNRAITRDELGEYAYLYDEFMGI
ncbi:ATP-binding protein [Cohnella lupini]|uniref:SpoVK/Ycf46/Vps4 family AAA+-type ATPase n=1 Tax=Cohnella lupini TaxID=1294267 RepID=A0A3D9I767_9BACL|nr:ATP-binding protein [Cohnella lupini]RED57531.1 SpoVK/Ycf46/Vps4 family AAA+-type ATPase [Cohnella lupini]